MSQVVWQLEEEWATRNNDVTVGKGKLHYAVDCSGVGLVHVKTDQYRALGPTS